MRLRRVFPLFVVAPALIRFFLVFKRISNILKKSVLCFEIESLQTFQKNAKSIGGVIPEGAKPRKSIKINERCTLSTLILDFRYYLKNT